MDGLSDDDFDDENIPETKVKSLESKMNFEIELGPIPLAPDGGIIPGFAAPTTNQRVRPMGDCICLKGPCRYLWEIQREVASSNVDGTWEALGIKAPMEYFRTCLAHPGTETELTMDNPVLDCNRWDPMTPGDLVTIRRRREMFETSAASVASNEEVEE